MNQSQRKVIKPLPGPQLISINERNNLDSMKTKYPNLEIIYGKAEKDDKPVSLDLAEMENSMQRTFDAATISIFGERIDRFERPRKFPYSMVIWLVGFLTGVGATLFVYTI